MQNGLKKNVGVIIFVAWASLGQKSFHRKEAGRFAINYRKYWRIVCVLGPAFLCVKCTSYMHPMARGSILASG